MTDLLAARSQMAMSLGFHIVFAAIGIAMPLLMIIAEWRWQRTGDAAYLELAKRWSRGTAILFAVGAVSGTVLSFELGLLWPRFMHEAGPIIGMPFSLEGFAFFTEAIFLGIYLYGWERVSARAHLVAGAIVALSGAVSGVFVVIANAWMNTPTGFRLASGIPVDIDPLAAMANPAAFAEVLHMTIAAYAATGIAVAGIHAIMLRRDATSTFHRHALAVALVMAVPAAIVQPLAGDVSARMVAHWQPVKLAALEGQFETTTGAPLRIGGVPDESARTTHWAIEIPHGLSLLAFHDPNATVRGLDAVPRDDWPPVLPVHVSFQVMVGLGTYMALVALWCAIVAWRGRRASGAMDAIIRSRRLLAALAIATPMGFLAVEAGWVVTEVGRQPWIVSNVLRTRDAVTPMPGLEIPFVGFTLLYIGLAVIVTVLLYRQIVRTPREDATHAQHLPLESHT